MMTCTDVARLLDAELRVAHFRDVSHNGLQIANRGPVTRVLTAVDASLETFEAAVAQGAQLALVHHGLSWGDSLARITGANYTLVRYAIEHNLAVYACHLPVDAHPTLGNNARLCAALGVTGTEPFFDYHGQKIALMGRLAEPIPRGAFAERVRVALRPPRLETFFHGPETVRTIGICSGGAPEGIAAAAEAGLDLYLSGEATLVGYNLARHCGMNALFAGHYATERCGIRAVGEWLAGQTGLEVAFLDLNLPY